MSNFQILFTVASVVLLGSSVGNVFAITLNNNLTISDHPIILVVSFDGFRYNYFEKVPTPTMDALKAAGVRVPYMEPVFPANTFPNHQSIATGLYPESHGIVDNTVFDPKYNKTLNGFNDETGFWNYHPDVLPIWIRNELAGEGRVSACLMWSGCAERYGENSNLLPSYYWPMDWDNSLAWEVGVNMTINCMTNPTKPANLVFLYFEQPDINGHAFGPNANETLAEISNADSRTAYLIKRLNETGLWEHVNLIMLSDHGMQEVTEQNMINITSMIDPNLLQFRHGGTPSIQLKAIEGRGDELYNSLTELSRENNFTVLKSEEMKDYPFHYSNSRRILDYVVMADPGFAFDDMFPTVEKYKILRNLPANASITHGVHGYSNQAETMRPFFIAHGPAFKTNIEHDPIRNVDIFPLISKILGLQEFPHNGSLDRVKDMLVDSCKFKSSEKNCLPSQTTLVRETREGILRKRTKDLSKTIIL